MIHYTPLSEHDIYEDDPTEYEQHKIISLQGTTMKVQQMEDGSFQVLQLLSTDPLDYLNASYTPGMRLDFNDFQS
ncbi:YlzJ-like family protein [Pontibacillus salicampi]|uniref:YlzJ-like family protein n=1 Tax=Pontibacillus salicampi TaxID=1449801 RepID=A0ABV6LP84_9BACI